MSQHIQKAFANLTSAPFASVLLQSLAFSLTAVILIGWGGMSFLDQIPQFGWEWVNTALSYIAGASIVILSILMLFPIAALFIGLFLEKIADIVEERDYPQDPPARGVPIWESLIVSLKFLVVLVVVNLLLLPFYLIPGLNVVLAALVNGSLIGREYFELVALRHVDRNMVKSLRRTHKRKVLGAGLIISLGLSIPLVNLIAPLFGIAMMVHMFKALER